MKLGDMASAVGRSVPAVMTLQRKYGLTVRKAYTEGYVVLIKKIMYLSILSVSVGDIKALLKRERRLLELLKVDSLQSSPVWFESLCTMRSGRTRLFLTGYNIEHAVFGDTVQTGLDFKERAIELFEDREMGADALLGLSKYAEVVVRVQRRVTDECALVQEAAKWGRRVTR
jgi:hypothetical protein